MADGDHSEGIIIHDMDPPGLNRPDDTPVPDRLPLLPLNDVVIFPGMIMPLAVDTKQSIRLVEEVIASSRYMLVALQRQRDKPDDQVGAKDLHPHGCMVRVLKMLKFPDETVRVLIQGVSRSRIKACRNSGKYLTAEYQVVIETEEDGLELEALTRNASQGFLEIIDLSPNLPDEIKVAVFNAPDASQLSDIITSNLNMTLPERQALLKERRPSQRLKKLATLLNREREVLRLGSEIQNRVSETFSRSQKEHILREQLKAIRQELGELDQQQSDLHEIEDRLKRAGLPDKVRDVADKEKKRLLSVPSSSPEYGVIRTYLDWLADLPWSTFTEDHLDLKEARAVLDHDHYDLEKIKDRILEYLAVLQLKQDLKGPILCLVGPPGVGKTSLGQSIARAMGRTFIRMSLGGVHDEAEIRGHRRTYIGALPGRIIQGLRNAGTANPVFMLDEIDKLGSDFRGDPASALLEVLDPEQNYGFSDHYLDVPFDLSRVMFITTANVTHTIPGPLLDRMETLQLPGYTREEKLQIARRYLVPKQIQAHGLKRSQVGFLKASLQVLISDYTREAGVRQLEREIARMCRKAAMSVVSGKTTRVRVDKDRVQSDLGPALFESAVAETGSEPGVATGLAWTPSGGDILFIEATRMPGRGQLILTGSLGEVMKESARTAHSYVRANAEMLNLPADCMKDPHDIHVHVPAGAIPKDGPSAGVAMAVALISLYRGRPLPGDLAMTGEISLRGRLLPVGGIKEKVLAASRAGIRRVILPPRNKKDLQDIPAEIRRTLRFKFAETLLEAARYALR